MSILNRIFGKGGPPEVKPETTFSRNLPDAVASPQGRARKEYIDKVAVILAQPADQIDPEADLVSVHGLADLDIAECVQVAEEVWAVSLMPNPMQAADYDVMMRRMGTLAAIMAEAERIRAERG
jgi:hypothetical protein